MAESIEELDKHVRGVIVVFVSLLCLTALTVLVAYIDLPTPAAISLALMIAGVKAALVLAYFMHLVDEKKIIYSLLILSVFFGLFALVVPYLTDSTRVEHTVRNISLHPE